MRGITNSAKANSSPNNGAQIRDQLYCNLGENNNNNDKDYHLIKIQSQVAIKTSSPYT